MTPSSSVLLGRAVEALDICGLPTVAARLAHWPSLGSYLDARDRLVWAAGVVVDLDHARDLEKAIIAVEACMATEACS